MEITDTPVSTEKLQQTEPTINGTVRSESMRLSVEDPQGNKGEVHTLNQLENDLTANLFVGRALEEHLQTVSETARGRMNKFGETFSSAWTNVVSSAIGAGRLTEVTKDYLVSEGHGRKEQLVSIAALPNDYPTEISGKPTHFSGINQPTVYSLGREVGHDGKGTIFITLGAFEMAKRAFLHNPEPQINKPAAETAENMESATETPENLLSNEEMVFLIGQHGKSEPVAAAVGNGLFSEKVAQLKPVQRIEFPQGYDYTDSREQTKDSPETYSAAHKQRRLDAIGFMERTAQENPGKTVINMHETVDTWDYNGRYQIDLLLPPRLIPKTHKDIKTLSEIFNQETSNQETPVSLQIKSMSDLGDQHGERNSYNGVGPNMLVVEIHTPPSLYEKIDPTIAPTEGNLRLKNDKESQRRIEKIQNTYIRLLGKLLPVINYEYSKLANEPKNDMLSHNPDFASK